MRKHVVRDFIVQEKSTRLTVVFLVFICTNCCFPCFHLYFVRCPFEKSGAHFDASNPLGYYRIDNYENNLLVKQIKRAIDALRSKQLIQEAGGAYVGSTPRDTNDATLAEYQTAFDASVLEYKMQYVFLFWVDLIFFFWFDFTMVIV